jgi:glycolate oxidase iron-sulfur subunit
VTVMLGPGVLPGECGGLPRIGRGPIQVRSAASRVPAPFVIGACKIIAAEWLHFALWRTDSARLVPGPHLVLGCFERALYPKVSRAARKLAPELDAPPAQGCCGALHAHNRELAKGQAMVRLLGEALPATIVTTSGGCAANLAAVLGRERVSHLRRRISLGVSGQETPSDSQSQPPACHR